MTPDAPAPAAPDAAPAGAPTRHPRWRRIVGTILLVVGIVLVPISISAIWVRGTLLNTDRYVATVGPLASNPQIQQALADDITNAVFTRVDVNQKIADALPPRGSFLAEPIAGAVKTTTDKAALRLVESQRFQSLWENANRKAHPKVVNVLTGGGSRVSTTNGTVSINVAQIFDNVKTQLSKRGITIFDKVTLPADKQEFVLFQSKSLEQAQSLVNLLQTLAWVLPFVALLCFAGAIALSGHRRRTVMRGALGTAFAVGVELVGLRAGRNLYLEAITSKKLPQGAAGAVWSQITNYLRVWSLTVVVVALVVAAGAWIVGRRSLARLGETGPGARYVPGALSEFVARSKPVLRGAGVALALVVLIVWNNPTGWTVVVIGLLLLVYLAAIEVVGRTAGGSSAPVATAG